MSSSSSPVYLVTGANRGIGLALVAHIAATHADAFIYAGVRDTTFAPALDDLSAKFPGRIATVKCISGDAESNALVAKEIQTRHGRLDTVIANAGIANSVDSVLNVALDDMREHFEINVLGPLVLFQSVHNLLKSSSSPRFVPISTISGSTGGPIMPKPMGLAAYGGSKAAVNFITRKIHFENEWLIAFPLAPGAVSTDMFNHNLSMDHNGTLAKLLKDHPLQTPAECATALLDIIDGSTRETHGGEFYNVDGSTLPW